jgi:hypothetical protein
MSTFVSVCENGDRVVLVGGSVDEEVVHADIHLPLEPGEEAFGKPFEFWKRNVGRAFRITDDGRVIPDDPA